LAGVGIASRLMRAGIASSACGHARSQSAPFQAAKGTSRPSVRTIAATNVLGSAAATSARSAATVAAFT
jgi:hypothetical protein